MVEEWKQVPGERRLFGRAQRCIDCGAALLSTKTQGRLLCHNCMASAQARRGAIVGRRRHSLLAGVSIDLYENGAASIAQLAIELGAYPHSIRSACLRLRKQGLVEQTGELDETGAKLWAFSGSEQAKAIVEAYVAERDRFAMIESERRRVAIPLITDFSELDSLREVFRSLLNFLGCALHQQRPHQNARVGKMMGLLDWADELARTFEVPFTK